MADFEFHINKQEWEALFDYLQANNYRIIPDMFYPTKQFNIITGWDDFTEHHERNATHFFIINDFFSLEPIVVSRNKYAEEPIYQVNQRKGGPYLDISYYRGFANNAIIPCISTDLSYYPRFIHFNNYHEFKASDELKDSYNKIVKFIKARCKVVRKNNKKYFIGYGALKELEHLL
ncbi:hypothetical protein [Mucilaginibacter psychrotolerans]|uniref:Uncharacterized protein n=1 Tax=Mucilaginibacter psychrotolerans TaxID=1524096 RepID=A0A4Y8S3L4_9SPHI|nr:hypothetical protein [Mucilaginibacter psychrotolerans]TFF33559.1 hypothetical protein E2R66_25120 [Mucilaginibacter psychrotolerans]